MGAAETDLVVFVHVPKAGGSTLKHLLARKFPGHTRYYADSSNIAASRNEILKKCRLSNAPTVISGHIGYGIHAGIGRSASYISMLRNPIDRTISHYYYVRQLSDDGRVLQARPWLREARALSLKEYVLSGTSTDIRNGQTKLMSGVVQGWDVPMPDADVDRSIYDRALQNVSNEFLCVGILEQFDRSLRVMSALLGWNGLPYYRIMNRNPKRPSQRDVDSDTLEAIVRANTYDLMLYYEATKLLSRRYESLFGRGSGVWQNCQETACYCYTKWLDFRLSRSQT